MFLTRLLTSEDEYKWFWHQIIYFPGTINIVSTRLYCHDYIHRYNSLSIFQLCTSTYSVHAGILKLWRGRLPCPLVVFSFHYRSRLPTSFVRSQLTLPIPAMRIRPPSSQNGAPIHRVRTHSLLRVQHTKSVYNLSLFKRKFVVCPFFQRRNKQKLSFCIRTWRTERTCPSMVTSYCCCNVLKSFYVVTEKSN
jgi:hypothetical protein